MTIVSRSGSQLVVKGTTKSPSGSKVRVVVNNPESGATVSTAQTLTVAGAISVTVSPKTKTMRGLTNAEFSASVSNNSNSAVTWMVNGIVGGNATTGIVTPNGIYSAPAVISASVTISAASVADSSKSASAVVTLQNPLPVITAATSSLTAGTPVLISIAGTGFAPSAIVTLGKARLNVIWTSSTKLSATGPAIQMPVGGVLSLQAMNPEPGSAASNVFPVSVQNPGKQLNYAAAKRFLEQAAWGPTPADIAHVQNIGIDAWLNEQFDSAHTPPSSYSLPVDDKSDLILLREQFFKNAVSGQDQLRQRVAFALGQIAVVSGVKLTRYDMMMPYQQLLLNDAFGTYANFLKDVTLSPSMGHYLDAVNNDLPTAKTSPDENYGRELMQLFTIGLSELNPDSSNTAAPSVPTYSEDDIRALARVLTGWTYPACFGTSKWTNAACFQSGMAAVEAHHDNTAKEFLGTPIHAGSADGDLDLALSTMEGFHGPQQTVPNLAPFVSRRLIQHLVTGNPDPQYVARVSAVFAKTGGDLKQVVRAVLEDPAAGYGNGGAALATDQGHLREPVLYAVSLVRALGATILYDPPLADYSRDMGQELFNSPSVFNYYSPFYQLPGSALTAPEFQILSQATAFSRANYAYRVAYNQANSNVSVDLSNFAQLASDTNPATQVGSLTTMLNAVSTALLGSPMSSEMLNAVMPAMLATTNSTTRARNAVFLVAAAPQYQVVR